MVCRNPASFLQSCHQQPLNPVGQQPWNLSWRSARVCICGAFLGYLVLPSGLHPTRSRIQAMHTSIGIGSSGASCLHGGRRVAAGSRRISMRAAPRDGATRQRSEAAVYTPSAPVTDAAVPEGHAGLHGLLYGEGGAEKHDTDSHYEFRQGEDDGSTLLPVPAYLESRDGERGVVGVYAIHDSKGNLQYIGFARNIVLAVKGHLARVGEERCALLRPMVFANKAMASRSNLERQAQVWLDEAGTLPPGNGVEADLWRSGRAWTAADLSPAERALHDEQKLKMRKAMGENLADGTEGEDDDMRTRRLKLMAAVEGDDWSAVIDGQTAATLPPQQQQQQQGQPDQQQQQAVVSPFSRANVHRSIGNNAQASPSSSSSGEAPSTAPAFPAMTVESVDKALEEVRPYLVADGGNVEVAGVEGGNVLLRLQGACGTCPSSSATMKMGIERSLRATFGEQLKEVMQVDAIDISASVASVDSHLNLLRPAIQNLGGRVEVMAVEGGIATVRYQGPKPLATGISAAIKDKFPDVKRVDLLDF